MMDKGKAINVGLIGCGVVGSGLVELFSENNNNGVNLKKIAVKDSKKPRKVPFNNFTDNADEILEDPGIDIVVELIGGHNPAKEYLVKAIKNGKHVVTANKAVISEHGPELFELARKHNVNIGFEGAVAGGIPIINPLLEQLSLGDITSITGILNGTTNFILTRMGERIDYESALKIAQEKGFAESDPGFDVLGLDAAQKIAILASLAYGRWIKPSEVYCEGIAEIMPIDVDYAKELGYAIKLLATARKINEGEVDVRVHPALISNSHKLSRVNEEFNAIYIQGSPFDEYFNVGKGAGKGPTAFSVYYDIVKIAEMARSETVREIRVNYKDLKIADQDKVSTEGYLRLYLRHVPGSLHSVVGVLANHGWNVKDSIQRSGPRYEMTVDGIKCLPNIITHEPLPFGVIKNTIPDLINIRTEKGKSVHGIPFYMRIHNSH
ncbi:homoserine dehydrogenase [Candidatus Woesearchaeota archaeon]|nr:homoserine dehydrogenase [Candidatus Woesearchaeota archaeon]